MWNTVATMNLNIIVGNIFTTGTEVIFGSIRSDHTIATENFDTIVPYIVTSQ
jgi:hypothetical protein